MAPDHVIARLAEDRHGLVTRWILIDAGLTVDQIEARLKDGRLLRVHAGVYIAKQPVAGAPQTWQQRVLAACLAGGPGSMASHTTAAALWRVEGFVPDAVEITGPVAQSLRIPGVRVHRLQRLVEPQDRTVLDGIPVTSLARTLVDVASSVDAMLFERSTSGALHRRTLTVTHLEGVVERLPTSGRRKLKAFGIAPPEEPVSSPRRLWNAPLVPRPRCGSRASERVSEFGSTPCKAHYRCSACREPFDYFKCL